MSGPSCQQLFPPREGAWGHLLEAGIGGHRPGNGVQIRVGHGEKKRDRRGGLLKGRPGGAGQLERKGTMLPGQFLPERRGGQ